MTDKTMDFLKTGVICASKVTLTITADEAREILSALSKQKKGEWIDISTGKGIFKNRMVKCSVCGNTLDLNGVNCGRGDANCCPNCFADMRPEPYKAESEE